MYKMRIKISRKKLNNSNDIALFLYQNILGTTPNPLKNPYNTL